MNDPVDFVGKDIIIGDLVAYPRRRSSSMWMQVGKVVDIKDGNVYCRSLQNHWSFQSKQIGPKRIIDHTRSMVVFNLPLEYSQLFDQIEVEVEGEN